jgi:hypothetical protein
LGNWLIFNGRVLTDSQIYVTHFGPFGWEKKKKFDKQLRDLNRFIEKRLQKTYTSAPLKTTESRRAFQQFKNELSNTHQQLKKDKGRDIENQKQRLEEISKETFGVEDGMKIAVEITNCITKVVLIKSANLIVKETSEIVAKQVVKEIAKITAKNGAKEAGKMGAKKIPVAGLFVGGVFALGKVFKGDIRGAGLELASGAASMVPGVGTAASVGIDVGLAAWDIGEAVDEIKVIEFQIKKGIIYHIADF